MRKGGSVIHPFHAEIGKLRDRFRRHAVEFAVIPAGDEAIRGQILGEGQHRPVMRLDVPPGIAVAELHAAIPQRKRALAAGAGERAGRNMGAEILGNAAGLQ
jgi:hypothetical protein